MNDTKKRIKAYKAALPGLKERIAAVAVLLAMSVAMMTSATFAWLTISRAPEVSGVNTTVASNGNLEIALVPKDGSQPAESAVGDSSAAAGQSVVDANVTWGNLVNLSDASYGLDNLTLRPAQLNRSALLTSPLFGAVYSQDGRIEKLSSSFAYATWQPPEGNVPGYFLVNDEYGIRAISSTTVEAVGFAQEVLEKQLAAETANLMAGSSYLAITQNSGWMKSLATIMGTFMTAKMNADQGDASLTNPTMQQEDIVNLRDIFAAFVDTYELQLEAEVALINYQLFLLNNSETGSTPYTNYTVEELLKDSCTEASLKAEDIQVTGLKQLKSDYKKLTENLAKLEPLCEQGGVKWADSGLNTIVNDLMNIGTCTLDGTPINNIGVSNAMGYLDGKVHSAVITNGVLLNFETLNGTPCKVEGLSVSAKVKRLGMTIPASISADITTSVKPPAQFQVDMEYADSLNKGAQGVEVAQDTYGLAIDLWVRTNAPDSYLTLEGNVLTKSETVRATATDANGNTVDLYTLPLTDEDGSSINQDIYKMEVDGQEVWYYAGSHIQVAAEQLEGVIPLAKTTEKVTVIGFDGENRIWEDSSMLSVDSTTQGSGSCYVYYADTPEDQARSMELLKSMNIAFVDEDGQLMATGIMDTEHYYAENGRVTVPLVLGSDAIDLGTDADGNNIYAITSLEQNVAKRITCIVYLDGTRLGNEDVLAASDIQGKLNIQFGSSTELVHAEDEKLMSATRSVSASLTNTEFSYDTSVTTGTPMTTTVTIRVDGDQPKNVTAFFLRAISSTQGSREETITNFVDNNDGTWTGTYTFTAPGNYVLRSVDLDGTTYDLAEPQTVTVKGFTVESLSCTQADANNHISIMTADSSSSVDLRLRFASNEAKAMPTTVQGRFLRSDGTAVNINFNYDATSGEWKGSARFVTSGEYTLQYLVLNGEYTELSSGLWQTATVYLGMKVAVYTDSPTTFLHLGDSMPDNQLNLYMKVRIMDNTGKEMQALPGAMLNYSMKGSAVKGMNAPLTWNASSGYYECTFRSKVGMYNFSTVTVGGNTISYATTSPSFFIQSPEPPSFNSGNTTAYQYVPNNNAVLSVLIDNCDAATVRADVVDGDGKTYELEGYLSGNSWVFDVPKNAEGRQDGEWTITQLRIWDVYDTDGKLYTEEDPLLFDMTGVEKVTAKVVSQVYAKFAQNQSQNFTGNFFLDPYTISGLHVDIYDFDEGPVLDGNGNALVTDVKLILEYVNGSSATYGGYTSESLTNTTDGATIEIPLVADSTGTRFVQQTDVTILYAGRYTTKLYFKVQGTEKTYFSGDTTALNNMPVFTVSTLIPYVKFTATDPAAGTTFTGANEAANATVDRKNVISDDGFSATVYYRASGSDNGCGGGSCTGYNPSSATMGLFDAGKNFTTATCTIISKGNGSNVVYSFKPSATADTVYNEQKLGSASGTTRNGLGSNAQATELIVTASDGVQYTFKLVNVISATAQY